MERFKELFQLAEKQMDMAITNAESAKCTREQPERFHRIADLALKQLAEAKLQYRLAFQAMQEAK